VFAGRGAIRATSKKGVLGIEVSEPQPKAKAAHRHADAQRRLESKADGNLSDASILRRRKIGPSLWPRRSPNEKHAGDLA